MKIILAPDKFKGSMTAEEAADIEKQAILSVIPDAEILCVPLADGGEGTVRALTAASGGRLVTCRVSDPLGRPAEAETGISGGTAFLEMAEASGMVLLKKEERDPLATSTFGTGEMIRAALDAGVSEIIIGIGGSATVDGGVGMAEALGYRFYDRFGALMTGLCGERLRFIAEIDGTHAEPRLKKCRFRTASDVT
ncbi:MAG: glycerate kinase, partial [Lentisphaeria bacterium]|nr:glycerate kinase [Lentisphaeria bacterium]